MIKVTRLDHSPIVVNANMIVFVEQSHDTVISLINQDKLVVRESADDVVDRVIAFQRRVHEAPYLLPQVEKHEE
ncbi:MAG: flagellar FlbD family protein [Chloroflexi bacterium]|nr:flagellar FlbD family protein [Chloroflexota bacterium]